LHETVIARPRTISGVAIKWIGVQGASSENLDLFRASAVY